MYTLRKEKGVLREGDLVLGLSKNLDKRDKENYKKVEIRKQNNEETNKTLKLFPIRDKQDNIIDEATKKDIREMSKEPDKYYALYEEDGDGGKFVGYIGVYKQSIIPIILLGISTLFIIIAIILMIMFSGNTNSSNNSDIQPGELTHLTMEQKEDLAQKLIDESMYEIRAQTLPLYKEGRLNICVENSNLNKISVKIAILNIDGEEVYYSDKLEPGNFIEWATVEGDLEAGPAKLRFDYLDTKDKPYQSSFVKINIVDGGN